MRFQHDVSVVPGVFYLRVYLPEEDATVFAEMQGVSVLFFHGVLFLQGEVHQLPVHIISPG